MSKSHQITLQEVEDALKATQKILLCSSVGVGTNKRFNVVISPTNLNPYTFEVETVIDGKTQTWDSSEPRIMVECYNRLP